MSAAPEPGAWTPTTDDLAEAALADALTNVIAVAELPDDEVPAAVRDHLREAGWELVSPRTTPADETALDAAWFAHQVRERLAKAWDDGYKRGRDEHCDALDCEIADVENPYRAASQPVAATSEHEHAWVVVEPDPEKPVSVVGVVEACTSCGGRRLDGGTVRHWPPRGMEHLFPAATSEETSR